MNAVIPFHSIRRAGIEELTEEAERAFNAASIPSDHPAMMECLEAVSRATGYSIQQLQSRSRRDSALSYARQVAMWQLHRHGFSMPQIGRFLGGRDHTTVLHGIRRVEQFMEAI